MEFKRPEEVAWIIICSLEQLSYHWPQKDSDKALDYLARLIVKDDFYYNEEATNIQNALTQRQKQLDKP
ncbi:hypothetical protein MBAV_004754 [Candidatus Magnetobacterium bavaricum]|uniref:Uncharacterized protein n=1 Tax=Candidatus Magnetobacterium bavaricum TaxID=29290 RepID=A0A0F3GM50_9BACT|nr:hypothetical protein MBAV_004754 [Candidatus Magnetobacterium bavaricum]